MHAKGYSPVVLYSLGQGGFRPRGSSWLSNLLEELFTHGQLQDVLKSRVRHSTSQNTLGWGLLLLAAGHNNYAQFCFRWFINLFLTFWWVQSRPVQSSPVHLSPVISYTLLSLVLRPEEVGHLVDLRIILITSLLPRPSITANAVESLVKLLRRMMSGEHLEAWLTRRACTSTAVHRKCHASQCSADFILHRGFTRPSTTLAVTEGLGTRVPKY